MFPMKMKTIFKVYHILFYLHHERALRAKTQALTAKIAHSVLFFFCEQGKLVS